MAYVTSAVEQARRVAYPDNLAGFSGSFTLAAPAGVPSASYCIAVFRWHRPANDTGIPFIYLPGSATPVTGANQTAAGTDWKSVSGITGFSRGAAIAGPASELPVTIHYEFPNHTGTPAAVDTYLVASLHLFVGSDAVPITDAIGGTAMIGGAPGGTGQITTTGTYSATWPEVVQFMFAQYPTGFFYTGPVDTGAHPTLHTANGFSVRTSSTWFPPMTVLHRTDHDPVAVIADRARVDNLASVPWAGLIVRLDGPQDGPGVIPPEEPELDGWWRRGPSWGYRGGWN